MRIQDNYTKDKRKFSNSNRKPAITRSKISPMSCTYIRGINYLPKRYSVKIEKFTGDSCAPLGIDECIQIENGIQDALSPSNILSLMSFRFLIFITPLSLSKKPKLKKSNVPNN